MIAIIPAGKMSSWYSSSLQTVVKITSVTVVTASLSISALHCFPQPDELENVQLISTKMAHPRTLTFVADALTENIWHRWIGRQGPVLWLPEHPSPDLTPYDFFLWGIKRKFFKDKRFVTYIPLNRINEAIPTVTKEMLTDV